VLPGKLHPTFWGKAALQFEGEFRWQLQAFTNLAVETLVEFFIRASNRKVVNLVQEKDFGTFESG